METLLFAEGDLGSVLGATARKPAERLGAWDADALLKAPEADVVEELIEEGTVWCPRLLRDEAWMPPPSETTQKFRNFGEVEERRVTPIVLVVPFDGDRDVFRLRASTFSLNPPRVLTLSDHKLRIAEDGPIGDAASVRARFDAQVDEIEKSLASSRMQIEEHNARIRAEVPGMVSRRRAQLLAARLRRPVHRGPRADVPAAPGRLRPADRADR